MRAIRGYQALSGTIIVETENTPQSVPERVVIYARVSNSWRCSKIGKPTGLLWNTQTVLTALVSAIWKRFEKYKVEPLKSRARADNDKEDLIADLVAIVYSLTARLYGQRRAKRKTERIVQELQTEEKHEAC